MKTIILFLFLLTFQFMQAQKENCQCIASKETEKNFEEKIVANIFNNKFLGSSNQFYTNWLKGDIILKDGNIIKNENLRYNRYMDELLWVRVNDYMIGMVQKEQVAGFQLYDPTKSEPMTFINLKKKNWIGVDSTSHYMQELAKGKIGMYVMRKAQKVGNDPEMAISNDYYLVKDNIFYKIRISRRSLLKFMAEERETMRAIIKENHLVMKNEDHFAKALKIYNAQNK